MKTTLSMAQVLQRFLADYKALYPLSPEQSKAIGSIRCCRTEVLGGRSLCCDHCHYQQQQFHSCRNRHCPQCQRQATEEWRRKQCEGMLPVPYFHMIFTLPHELNGWAQLHPEVMYRLLFKAAWSTLKTFGEDPKRLHGKLGMTAVLHTGNESGAVVNYLSRYTHRIAISEQRLVAMDDQHVTFHWKDYAADNAHRLMTLSGTEFIRRFLMHVLPDGFMRIRHYGLMANCHRKAKQALIKDLLRVAPSADMTEITGLITSIVRAFTGLYPLSAMRAGPSASAGRNRASA